MTMVRELPPDDRPRERLLTYGSKCLSNAELLALLIRSGSKEMSALQLAERVLCIYKEAGVAAMANITPAELTQVKGIGNAKAAEIIAAIELGRRLSQQCRSERVTVRTPEDAAMYAMPQLRYEQREHFCVILLNVKNQILSMPVISIGTLTSSVVHPREVFKAAVQQAAASMILVHNHPSGEPDPSREDISMTARMVKVGNLMDIPVLDHVIIGDGKYISLKEKGFIK